ncbi:MAG: GntR family transcriptional regulator [Lapillicoccus sp.]
MTSPPPAQVGAGRPPRVFVQRRKAVADEIKAYILREQLRPGDPLPTENELCAAIGASRSSVREAVQTLAALDIVEVRHGYGTYVGRMSLAALVQSLAFRGLLSSEDDRKVLEDLVDVRQMLEVGLASAITEGMAGPLRSDLEAVVSRMDRRAKAGEQFFAEDREFHLLLVQPAVNDLVVQLTGAFWDIHSIVAPRRDPGRAELRRTAQAHSAIVEAAVTGDVLQLTNAIRMHYEPIRARIRQVLERR